MISTVLILQHMLWIEFMTDSCEIALRRMSQNTFDVKSKLVQVMAWSHQATSHYLSQFWLRSMSPYKLTHLTFGNRFQCNLDLNTNIFVPENAFENIICKVWAILPQCANDYCYLMYLHHPFGGKDLCRVV